jgi:hypothetical protein
MKYALILAGLLLSTDARAQTADVRPDVPVDSLSFTELRKLMLGNRQFWTANLRVTLLIRAPGTREREAVLKTIYRMSEAQFQQYWIAKVFREEATAGPKDCIFERNGDGTP